MTSDLNKGDTQLLIGECINMGLLRNEAAYVLATAFWETAQTVEPVVEAFWLSEAWRAANLRYYPWHGRGYVQLTWEENYKRAQDELGLGTLLTDDPDEALKPQIAAQVICMGMVDGWFTGKKLSDYINLQHSDYTGARAIVNGRDKASEIAALAVEYEDALLKDGYGVEGDVPDKPDPLPVDIDLETLKRLLEASVARTNSLFERIEDIEAVVKTQEKIVADLVRWKTDD